MSSTQNSSNSIRKFTKFSLQLIGKVELLPPEQASSHLSTLSTSLAAH